MGLLHLTGCSLSLFLSKTSFIRYSPEESIQKKTNARITVAHIEIFKMLAEKTIATKRRVFLYHCLGRVEIRRYLASFIHSGSFVVVHAQPPLCLLLNHSVTSIPRLSKALNNYILFWYNAEYLLLATDRTIETGIPGEDFEDSSELHLYP